MNSNEVIKNDIPLSFLTVGQFRQIIAEIASCNSVSIVSRNTKEIIGKKECSELTGYSVNTINKMICEKTIPYYKRGARVFFKTEEITDWLLNKRIDTVEEYVLKQDKKLRKR